MTRRLLLFLLSLYNFSSYAQDLKVYEIYNNQEATVSFEEMIEDLSTYQVVLFGELHDHPVIHWLQLKTMQALYRKDQDLVLGAEMFETDNQLILEEYLQDKISERRYEEEMRLWDNYKTDYKPLVQFAKMHKLPFIATNVPRRYASAVASFGLDTLASYSREARSYMAQLPLEVDTLTPGYSEMFKMMGGNHGMSTKAIHLVQAQAIKDATMAERILQKLPDSGTFLHFNGDYHSKDFGGIYWYLKAEQNDLDVAIITVQQSAHPALLLDSKENDENSEHFTIVVPEDFNRSF